MSKLTEGTKHKIRPWIIEGVILFAILAIALCLRTIPMQKAIFGSGFVNFLGPDPWYHVRLIENLVQHFPFRISFDPYTFFPYGQDVWFAPFFDGMIGFCAWVIGLGSPTSSTVQNVAAYFPAVLGALVSIPVYFIGKALFDRKVGLLAALIISILPGPFLMVSLLGYTDHHVAEVFFSTLAVLFLMLALREVKTIPIDFSNLQAEQWRPLVKPLTFALLSGIALGLYLLTWVGGLLFVFLFFCWAVIMYIVGQLKRESTDYLCILGVPVFLVALLMNLPFLDQLAFGTINIVSLIIGAVALPILSAISRLLKQNNLGPAYYPLALVGIGAVGLAAFYFINPAVVNTMLFQFRVFTPDTNLLTINEVRPIFFAQGPFSLVPFWNAFTTIGIIAPLAFIFILIATIKNTDAGKILFLLWALIIFIATTGQIRFAEYLAVSFALLGAFFIWKIIDWVPSVLKYYGFNARKENRKEKTKRKKEQARLAREQLLSQKNDMSWRERPLKGALKFAYIGLAVILVFFLGIYPNIQPALANASVNAGINKDWYDALIWMKNNTPEPFQDPGFFNQQYQKPAGDRYNYPSSAYGVMSWWDFGHYITEVAHRIPNSNPHQNGAASAAAYFTAQNELAGNQILNPLGSRYVIIDLDIITPFDSNFMTRMFPDVVAWSGKNLSQFVEVYLQPKDGKLSPVAIFHPEYYYCMSTRLFNFHGAQVIPNNSTTVISYKLDSGYKIIQTSQNFATYEMAKAFVDSRPNANYEIAGTSPFISPVPLEKLTHYEQIYQSQFYMVDKNKNISMPYLEIFKYVP